MAAHITAASPSGPRYDPSLSSTARISAENGIWLCQTCAKLVDNDEVRFTAELLRQWKREAESAASALVGKPSIAQANRGVAESKFISAFAGTLGSLTSGDGDPFHVLSSNRNAHDAAIVEFRYHMRSEWRDEFDIAAQDFRSARERTQPGILRFYEREATGRSPADTTEELVRAIERLLAFADR